MHLMHAVVGATMLAPLLEVFDRFVERYAVASDPWSVMPRVRWFQWGEYLRPYGYSDYYVHIRLPSLDWRYCMQHDAEGWHRRVLFWTRGRGWSERFEWCEVQP